MSAFWIIVANSWQQTPAGYDLVEGKPVLRDFFSAVFNPSTLPRFIHTVDACLITGAFFVIGIAAWLLLKGLHRDLARRSVRAAVVLGALASLAQLPIGHWHAVQVAETQPVKLAAFEGLWETRSNAPLLVFGVPNAELERTEFPMEVPSGLSLLVGMSPDTVVRGLKEVGREDRPPLALTFFPFHLMFMLGMAFIAFSCCGAFLLWRGGLERGRWFLKLALLAAPLPIVANELGWIAAEVGRQPWAVQGLLRTRDAVSVNVPAWEILASICLFGAVYAVLLACWLFLLRRKILQGPVPIAVVERHA
jgi:cytochrome d ubiquinol oxidase subunit I